MRKLSFAPCRLMGGRMLTALSAVAALAVAGCGGGGFARFAPETVVIGKVTNASGSPVPGATVTVVGTSLQAFSLQQGGYSITNTPAGVITLLATTTVNGGTYSGSTQIWAIFSQVNSNANIVMSPHNQQGTITGLITNSTGQALGGVGVVIEQTGETAYTAANGQYTLANVSTAASTYTLVAAAPEYQNSTFTVTTPAAGSSTTAPTQKLAAAANQPANAPTSLTGMSATEPSKVLLPSAESAAATTTNGGIYETIRRQLSPRYASLATGRTAGTHNALSAQNVVGGYIVEVNLFWNEVQTPNLAGFQIFEGAESQPLSLYDQLPNPAATEYDDIYSGYNAGTQYSFAVQAVNTSDVASSFSNTTSMTPLGAFNLTYPPQAATVPAQSTVTWGAIPGATSYAAYVYNAYPSFGSTQVAGGTGLGASYQLPATLPAGTYYLVAAAVDANGDVSLSDITPFNLE